MKTACKQTETAARVKSACDNLRIHVLEPCDPGRVFHIDSKVMVQAEAKEKFANALKVAEENGNTDEDNGPVERELTKTV